MRSRRPAVTLPECYLAMLASLVALPAPAGDIIDCPLREAPFSVDSPLIDILLSDAARRSAEQTLPGLVSGIPGWMQDTKAPSFAAIVTLRFVAHMQGLPTDRLARVDEVLGAIALTDRDRADRCARYDEDFPEVDTVPASQAAMLVFTKVNGFDHGPTVDAATHAISRLAGELGWHVDVTDRAGAFTPTFLSRYHSVIWNNVSGDVLTLTQREAFRDYITAGGGYLGLHASGGDFVYFWDWYAKELLRAQFVGHPMNPQFQDATLHTEVNPFAIGEDLPSSWNLRDEWYSFEASPRAHDASIVVTIDEESYEATNARGEDLRMGDHPLAWAHHVGDGRAFYTAIGHRPDSYAAPEFQRLLLDALRWVAGAADTVQGRDTERSAELGRISGLSGHESTGAHRPAATSTDR